MHCKNNSIWCQIQSKWARQGQWQGYGRKKFTINIKQHSLSFIFSAAQFSLKTLYCSLVRSNLEHCSVVWCPFTKRNIDKLERIQGSATGFILRSNEQYYVYFWANSFRFHVTFLFYKVFLGHLDVNFFPISTATYWPHFDTYSLRKKFAWTNLLKHSHFYMIVGKWKSLPLESHLAYCLEMF